MSDLTTEVDVRNIIKTDLDSSQIGAFIADASLWVSEELSAIGYSTGRLELIARYLTCALIRIRDLGLKNTTIKETSESYQVDPQVTDYLLRAAAFDTTGKVRAFFIESNAERGKPVLFGIGTTFKTEAAQAEDDDA